MRPLETAEYGVCCGSYYAVVQFHPFSIYGRRTTGVRVGLGVLGFRAPSLGVRAQGLGFKVYRLWLRVWGLRSRMEGFRAWGSRIGAFSCLHVP